MLGLVLARFHMLDVGLTVYITFLYSIPSVALVPLIVLWAGYETTAKIIILFMFAFFPMVINTYQGVKSVDPKLLEVGRAFRCSERQLWSNIVLPAALPFIVTGIRLAVGRGMIGMVLADLYTAISGIGYLIVRTASTFQVDKMFVPIVTLGLLGVTLTALLRMVEKKRRAVDRGGAGRLISQNTGERDGRNQSAVPGQWQTVRGHDRLRRQREGKTPRDLRSARLERRLHRYDRAGARGRRQGLRRADG